MNSRRPKRLELITKHPAVSAGLVFVLATATAGAVLTMSSSSVAPEQQALGRTAATSELVDASGGPSAAASASTPAAATTSSDVAAAKHGAHASAPAAKAAAATKAAQQPAAPMDASMPGMVMAAPKPGTWVSVNAAAQKRETTAFFATKPARITGNPVTVPEFNAQCTTSHRGSNDPIVFPGQTGASHNHTFFGNDSTNARTTLKSLLAKTKSSCRPAGDHSSYWVPTLLVKGKAVVPNSVTVYYGSSLSDHSKVQPFPQGLRMVVGDPRNQVKGGSREVNNEFYCQGEDHVLTASGFPTCTTTKTGEMNFDLVFPECWDGKHLDSPDHKAHMAVGGPGGICPATHPVQVPSLHFVIHYPRGFNPADARLSSGTAFSMHGDFFNAWEKPALAKRVRNCINQSVKCTTAGTF
jgi:hypothetical protein